MAATALAATGLAIPMADAHAAATIDRNDRAAVQQAYLDWLPTQQVDVGWTGSTQTCDPGTVSDAVQSATLDSVNYFRAMAGLSAVAMDPALSANAQKAALIQEANGSLSHQPPQATSKCWTPEGFAASGTSNLAQGTMGAQAIPLYMRDPSDSNVEAGHRYAVLSPTLKTVGSGTTDLYNALDVQSGARAAAPAASCIAWPSAGYFPQQLEPDGRWSVYYSGADFSSASIKVTVGGQTHTLTRNAQPYGWYPDQMVWEMGDLANLVNNADTAVDVSVTGIKNGPAGGACNYQVKLFNGKDGMFDNTAVPTVKMSGFWVTQYEPIIGKALQASSGSWSPAADSVAYQWFKDDQAIPGATSATYTPVASDDGARLRVEVTATAPAGSEPATLKVSSEASKPVSFMPIVATTQVTASGTMAVGSTLTASGHKWMEKYGTLTQAVSGVSEAYQWYRDGAEIPGATAKTYVLTDADKGAYITVTVTGSKAGDKTGTSTSAKRILTPFSITMAKPTVQGDSQVGQVLSTQLGAATPAMLDYAYQWLRDGQAIEGANGSTYTLTGTDRGATIAVKVTASKEGVSATATSDGVGPIEAAPQPPNGEFTQSGNLEITGNPVVGATLSATGPTWDPAPESVAYQWFRNGQPIAGAGASSYALTAADQGATISVTVTVKRAGYNDGVAQSVPVGPVSDEEPDVDIVNVTKPVITGDPVVGQKLTAGGDTWSQPDVRVYYQWMRDGVIIPDAVGKTYVLTDADLGAMIQVYATAAKEGFVPGKMASGSVGPVTQQVIKNVTKPAITGETVVGSTLTGTPGTWDPADASVAYQWLRNGAPITGATSQTYALNADDLGAMISLRVTASKSGYEDGIATSDEVGPVEKGVIRVKVAVKLTGIPQVGKTVKAEYATWLPAGLVPDSVTYQWYRDDVAIAGATASSYTLTPDDANHHVLVKATAARAGYEPATSTSNDEFIFPADEDPAAPKNTTAPTISGATAVGSTLTANPGVWDPADVTIAYQWLRGGTAITGATGKTYVTVAADAGAKISVRVTATSAGGSASATSNEITVAVPSECLPEAAQQTFAEINKLRVANGLPEVVWSDALADKACWHVKLRANGDYSAWNDIWNTYPAGYSPSGAIACWATVEEFKQRLATMDLDTVLGTTNRSVGVGYYLNPDNGRYYVVVLFSSTAA